MAKKAGAVAYAVVDAFTDAAFKGNPAAICYLSDDRDDIWKQRVANEFNLSETAFIISLLQSHAPSPPRFRLSWFTPVSEVELCGHATLAAAHFLFKLGYVDGDAVEFVTRSGILTAKRVDRLNGVNVVDNEVSSIELDFPLSEVVDCDASEFPSIPMTLGGSSVVGVKKTAQDDFLVELSSGDDVAGLQPQFNELRQCPGRGVIVTGPAPHGSEFDFFSRFFCPKLGIDEDPVCGSAHCALAPYWQTKLWKNNLVAYMASPRSGRLDLTVDEKKQRVLIRGDATTVMVGTLLA